ncbi:MAG: DUF1365 domain-containing protein [Myxococcales bacterium]|nr:DUF1365 domain-containing protein [Myxococcales bacterium]MCB9628858.1 DUF1365 domain-containing protein [Sandaracinaceae bacterium]
MTLASALYTGSVRHQRLAPRPHAFRYTLGLFYLDLDELEQVAARLPCFSLERPNVLSFRRSDYLGDPRVPLKEAVLTRVYETLGHRPEGPVRMLTHPRYFGYCFNPVTFYYCFEADGQTLDTIVAEITNTPWKERHAYVLRARDAQRGGGRLTFAFDKAFHVSPFLPMDLRYRWRFSEPADGLHVHMDALRDGESVFVATLTTAREPLDLRHVARALLRLPPMTIGVMVGIHYQALRVYLKRNPFYEHPRLRKAPTS